MSANASILATLVQRTSALPLTGQSIPIRKLRILVVDDDLTTQRLERLVLSHAGYDVSAAADGEEAWAALLAEPFDLMLTDHNMPRLCGLDLVMRMRAAGMRLPVVLSSGSLDLAQASECPCLELAAVLIKPFGIGELMDVVKRVLPLLQSAGPGTVPDVGPTMIPVAHRPPELPLAVPALP